MKYFTDGRAVLNTLCFYPLILFLTSSAAEYTRSYMQCPILVPFEGSTLVADVTALKEEVCKNPCFPGGMFFNGSGPSLDRTTVDGVSSVLLTRHCCPWLYLRPTTHNE